MFAITAVHTIKPEQIQTYHALMAELAAASRKEEGCMAYHLLQSDSDPRVHLLIEQWKDEQALDTHSKTPYFQRIVPQLSGLFDAPEQAERHQVIA